MPNTGNKYGAHRVPCNCGGVDHWHQSKKERSRCYDLHKYQLRGEITNLELQVPYPLKVNGQLVCTYIADFTYFERHAHDTWDVVIEDTKGVRTDVYILKKKLMAAIHGVTVRET